MTESADIVIRREGRAGRITLNRPKALNALTYPQVGAIWAALQAWQKDPAVALVLLDGAGDRAMCAGGDVRALYDGRTGGSAFARKFWAEEYALNALIGRYPKPFVAIQHGIVMGGGIGLSGHASHRVVTESSVLAMPETGIGLIPDVGGTWLLVQAPGETGTYLALTGERMGPEDAIYAGFSDVFVPAARMSTLIERLIAGPSAPDDILRQTGENAGPSSLGARRGDIDRAFSFDTVGEIMDALAAMPGEWAGKTRADMEKRSPKAMAVTLAALRRARKLASLEAALNTEFRLAVRLYEDGEFIEGVRAQVVDKDRSPKWRPARLADLTPAAIDAFFAPLPDGGDIALAPPAE